MKVSDLYKEIAKDIETKFDTSNYGLEQAKGTKGTSKRVIDLMNDELG